MGVCMRIVYTSIIVAGVYIKIRSNEGYGGVSQNNWTFQIHSNAECNHDLASNPRPQTVNNFIVQIASSNMYEKCKKIREL